MVDDEKARSVGRRMEDVTLRNVLSELHSLTEMISNLGNKAIQMDAKLDKIVGAFPDGDDGVDGFSSHRIFHIEQIKAAQDSHDLRQSLIKNLSTWGVIGTLGVIAGALWLYAQVKLGVPAKGP